MPDTSHAPVGRILAIDDDKRLLENFGLCLEGAGYRVSAVPTLQEGFKLAAAQPFHVCLLDRNIGYDSGMDALPKLRELAPQMRIIMVTAHSRVDDAVKALSEGASDYLVKPCSPEQLRIAVARQMDTMRLLDKLERLERETSTGAQLSLTSKNPAMSQVLAMARQVARTDANLLLLGESGTGKGMLANAIHGWSARAEAPFATINCPSLSAELMESELFGHAKGSFTGATQSTQGRVSNADGGTLFLDEVGDFPLALQPKLLRFIQDKEYERIGDPGTRRADVRIVSATNRDLEAMVADNSFRLDLLYRLNVISLTLPALRDRLEDLEDLALGFIRKYATSYHLPANRIAPEALARMRAYRWPGNVRELQNVIERAVILCTDEVITSAHLALGAPGATGAVGTADAGPPAVAGAPITLDVLERRHIEAILASSDTLDAAARTLGIDGSTLYRKRKSYGLQ
ncbi:sigma-54-dependent transcriptional regulator [Arenimonas sp. MALMAid1274]|uniref:sigma-54-dependent transcriptional regulator n=1 Tax=Arenimonas sp. MALMAid1274 TaxID=3411630 RepID=UPI003B9E4516